MIMIMIIMGIKSFNKLLSGCPQSIVNLIHEPGTYLQGSGFC
jgi:hypothetical protein